MQLGNRIDSRPLALAFLLGLGMLSISTMACAQSSGFELHAHGKITPAEIGVPPYPGAQLFRENESDPTVDMGFSFGDTSFRLLAANYITSDSQDKVLNFYRKPLSRYGEVLECKDGQPVGKLQRTTSGLTCDSSKDGKSHLYGKIESSHDLELRAGTPHKFRIVGINSQADGRTHFGLVYLELPKDGSSSHSD